MVLVHLVLSVPQGNTALGMEAQLEVLAQRAPLVNILQPEVKQLVIAVLVGTMPQVWGQQLAHLSQQVISLIFPTSTAVLRERIILMLDMMEVLRAA